MGLAPVWENYAKKIMLKTWIWGKMTKYPVFIYILLPSHSTYVPILIISLAKTTTTCQ